MEGNATIKANFFKVDVNELRDVVEGNGFSVSAMYFNSGTYSWLHEYLGK